MMSRTMRGRDVIAAGFSADRQTYLAQIAGLAMEYASNPQLPLREIEFSSVFARAFLVAAVLAMAEEESRA